MDWSLKHPDAARRIAITIALGLAALVMLALERAGHPFTPHLRWTGDFQREAAFLAQFGQFACATVAMILVWQLDKTRRKLIIPAVTILIITTLSATAAKHVVGRVRPGREAAGSFLGASQGGTSSNQSFPSGHSAAAIAFAVMLSKLYPRAKATFWVLALLCAFLRYLTQAHWLSDVFAGLAFGYAISTCLWWLFIERRSEVTSIAAMHGIQSDF